MKAIMTKCFNLRRAEKREDPEVSQLHTIVMNHPNKMFCSSYSFSTQLNQIMQSLTLIDGVINIDTQTLKGLANARSNKVIKSGLVDVFATSHFLEGSLLFTPDHRGRAFTILEHPVIRAEKLYRSRDSRLEWLGLSGFLESSHYIDNWVVRSLTNDKTGELTEDHLLVAKGILSSKFFLGIAEYLEETIKRFAMYYGLDEPSEGCLDEYLNKRHDLEDEIPHGIERGDSEWNTAIHKEKFDIMLYYYALELFAKQGSTLFHRPYVDHDGKPIDFAELKRKEMLKNKILALIGMG